MGKILLKILIKAGIMLLKFLSVVLTFFYYISIIKSNVKNKKINNGSFGFYIRVVC